MLRWRTLTAAILAPIAIAAILLGPYTIAAFLLLVVIRAAFELSRTLEGVPLSAASVVGTLPLALSIPYGPTGVLAGAVLGMPLSLLWLIARPKARNLSALLVLLLMALWVGAPLAHLVLMGELFGVGTYLVIIAVVGPWISDTGAYFAGSFFGRHPLVPSLSPKKTVEGSIGGVLVTMAAVAPFAYAFLGLDWLPAAIAGLTISVLSQAGDLFESILKRLLGLKDLGRALPGHGGILDRIDSLLFTAPASYYLYILFMGATSA